MVFMKSAHARVKKQKKNLVKLTITLSIINVNLDFICRSFPQVLASISTHLHVSKDPALGQVTWFNSIGLVLPIGKLL